MSSNTFLDGPGANGDVVLRGKSHDNLVIANVGDVVTDIGTNNEVIFVDCSADLHAGGTIDAADLAFLLGRWGGSGAGDLDASGTVDAGDLAIRLGAWGSCPG